MIKSTCNSTIGLTAAFLLTIILHEIAHYLMSIALNYEAVLYHNRVFTKTTGIKSDEVLIAGIAPVFSLVQGIVAYKCAKLLKTSSKSLFMLWFGLAGMITFFGYLIIAPVVTVGDTGKVFNLLNIPISIQIIIAILSLFTITIILIKSTPEFERYAWEDYGSIQKNRKKWSFSLILIPLLITIVIVSLFQFPIPHIASIIATVCTPFSIMAVFGTFMGKKEKINKDLDGTSINSQFSYSLIILLITIIALNRFLVYGL